MESVNTATTVVDDNCCTTKCDGAQMAQHPFNSPLHTSISKANTTNIIDHDPNKRVDLSMKLNENNLHMRHLDEEEESETNHNIRRQYDNMVGMIHHASHRFRKHHPSDGDICMGEPDGLMTDGRESFPADCAAINNSNSDPWQTFAGVAGNVLEWYDFAVFGFLSDIIGEVFFPPGSDGDAAAFLVFGGAFVMRPIGGICLGYLGDTIGRKKALVTSVFLMAFPTFAMGLLPAYDKVGYWATVMLILVRLLQGLSVGGQLMSSLVFTLENHDPSQWGLYGSFVMAAANFGTLLGGLVGFTLREMLTKEELVEWGWRLPFLSGIVVSVSGCYLNQHGGDHDGHHYHQPGAKIGNSHETHGIKADLTSNENNGISKEATNPIMQAFSRENRRSLLASSLVPMLWSAGFYLSFVWMSIFMIDLIDSPVPKAFGINCASLFLSVCIFFPFAGSLSDRYGRIRIMTIGGVGVGLFSPIAILLIGTGLPLLAFLSQCCLGIFLSLWGGPMCAWLVETFDPDARLTSVSIGYNIAQAIAGGITPYLATILSKNVGVGSPGWILFSLAVISLIGLRVVAPTPSTKNIHQSTDHSPKFESLLTTVGSVGASEEAEIQMIEMPEAIDSFDEDEDELI